MEGRPVYNYRKLKGKIKEVYDIQSEFAKALNIADTTLINKLNNTSYFYQTEIDLACELLGIPVDGIGVYWSSLQYLFWVPMSDTQVIHKYLKNIWKYNVCRS